MRPISRALILLGIVLLVAVPLAMAGSEVLQPAAYLPLITAERVDPELEPTPDPSQPIPTIDPSLPVPTPDPSQPASSSVFGIVMTNMSPDRGFDGALAAGATWMRSNNNLYWRDVEPIEGGGYHWDAPSVQLLEQEMIRASEYKLKLVLIVRSSPRWAIAPYTGDCAPIAPDKYTRFASFLAAAVARYSQPPFNVVYWQVGNEPDAYIFNHDSGYGCWGVRSDPYYGGRAYGEMLKVVYPAMKAANPSINVLHGSLLLASPYNPKTGSGLSARFLEGVLLAGAANSFDILPFNSYYASNDLNGADWKTPYLRNLLSTYKVPPKPMLITEQAILCDPICPQKAAFAVGRYYARALSYNLLGSLWYIYDSDGFHNTALVDPNNPTQPRMAYLAYKYASSQLTGATPLGALQGQPSGVEGYTFAQANARLILLWSSKAQPVALPVAADALVSCSQWDGSALACANSGGVVRLTADLGPIYVHVQ